MTLLSGRNSRMNPFLLPQVDELVKNGETQIYIEIRIKQSAKSDAKTHL